MIKYLEYIDKIKTSGIIQILSINSKGCNPNNEEKIEMLIESIKRLQLDVVLLNEVNTKWNSVNKDKMEQKMKQIDRGILVKTADSKQWNTTPTSYLPRGLVSIFFSKCLSVI